MRSLKIYLSFLIVLITLIACTNMNSNHSVNVNFNFYDVDSVKFLKISVENHNNYGIYFPEIGLNSFKFFNQSDKDVSDSIFKDTYLREPMTFKSNFVKSKCDGKTISNPIPTICSNYDSLIRYKNTEIGKILFETCGIEYNNFLKYNNLSVIEDSLFFKSLLIFKYSSSIFIKPYSVKNWCFNVKYVLDSNSIVKVLFDYVPPKIEGYQKISYAPYDSLRVKNGTLKEIDSYHLFMNKITSDTFVIK